MPKNFFYRISFLTFFSVGLVYAAEEGSVFPAQWNGGMGFLVGGGRSNPGLHLSWEKPTSIAGLSWGWESGIYFNGTPAFYATVPVLGSLFYRFQSLGKVTPSVGASVGTYWSFGSGARLFDWAFLLHPMLRFPLWGETLGFFRMSFGGMGAVFQFAPSLGVTARF
jgi:hypothetical protein